MTETEKTLKISKPASTVILAREHNGELQVYLLRRSSLSSFMPGNYVFPGGTIDQEDRAPGFWKTHVDINSESISSRLGGNLTIDEALAYGVAAIRETFEEAGVFLAYRNQKTQQDLVKACDRRMATTLPKGWLQEWAVSEGWNLTFSGLARWSHWITPEARSRRYDTRFFLALMPSDQQCRPDTKETTHGTWVSPKKGLTENLQGKLPLSPPTLVTLHELLQYPDMKALEKGLRNQSWGEARLPILIRSSQDALIVLPWDPMYDEKIEKHSKSQENIPVPLGKSFSRLWYHDGIWRPV